MSLWASLAHWIIFFLLDLNQLLVDFLFIMFESLSLSWKPLFPSSLLLLFEDDLASSSINKNEAKGVIYFLRLNLSSCPYPHPFSTPLLPHQKATGPLLFKDILSTCTFDLGAACGEVIKSTALKSVRNAVETQRRIWEWPGEKFLLQDTIFRLSM